ncbi:MAG: WG repeat-containing protein, partial [Bacteroidota bacterium]
EIVSKGKFYFAKREEKWDLYNKFGRKINEYPLEEIRQGVPNYFIAKRNGFWGIIDFDGEVFIEFKYDAINLVSQELYTVQFFNKWGIMNKYGNWMIQPNFQALEVHDRLAIGSRGALRSFFFDGALFANLTYPIVDIIEGVPVLEDSGKYGLINPTNSMLYRPTFDTVMVRGELLHFYKDSAIMLMHRDGIMKVGFEEGFQGFGEYSYGHVSVKRNGKWGFVDRQSRLRIANRYDDVRPFSQGFAPVKLKGKWGFIDTKENLMVQPFYDDVAPFHDGLSVFKTDAGIGLVDAHGKERLSGWSRIDRLATGNYLVVDNEGKVGLVDKNGSFILRPDFTWLDDLENEIIVKKNQKMGALDYQGNQLIKIEYSEVKKTDNFLVAKK